MRNAFQALLRAYSNTSVVVRILIGLIVGATLGVLIPNISAIKLLGSLFVASLRAIAPLLVFILVIAALSKKSATMGSRFRFVVVQYLLATFLAAGVAVAGSFFFPSTLVFSASSNLASQPPSGVSKVFESLLLGMLDNPIKAVSSGNYIGILFWAVVFGSIMKTVANEATRTFFEDFSNILSKTVKLIISFAGFGVMGLVYANVSENGIEIFSKYGHIVAVLVSCMLFVAFVVNPIMAAIVMRRNPYPLVFQCFRESAVTAFFTRSSAANIPVNLSLCKKLNLDENFYSVSIPLGATVNMSGAAVTITVFTLAAVHTLGIQSDIWSVTILSVIATLASCGASGVAGGSLLLIPLACSMFGINQDVAMQVVGIGFIIGVVQDSFETALNSSSDVLFTAVAEYREMRNQNRCGKKNQQG
jgi:serine/threonine transporter